MLKPRTYVIWLIFLVIFLTAPWQAQAQSLQIYVLNVGQGDSILIKTPHNHKILIDGGPDQSVVTQLEQVLPFWDRTIDAIIPSHPEADHIAGLVAVMQHYRVKQVLLTPATNSTVTYQAMVREIALEHLPTVNLFRGSSIDLDDGVHLHSLWPPASSDWAAVKNLNDVAQVCKLEYRDFTGLLTADAGANIDQQLEQLGDTQSVTFLKVPHHGSKYGMDQTFVQQLHPLISVVSVGAKNRYGHPAPSAIGLLKQVGTHLYRTDQDGRVALTVNADGLSLKTSPIQYNKQTTR